MNHYTHYCVAHFLRNGIFYKCGWFQPQEDGIILFLSQPLNINVVMGG